MAKRYKYKKRTKLDVLTNLTAILLTVFLIVLLTSHVDFNSHTKKLNVDLKNVSALNIPYNILTEIKNLSEKYQIDFSELITILCFENNFFPDKLTLLDVDLEQKLILNYDTIKKNYRAIDIKNYSAIFSNILNEIKCFPIPTGFDALDDNSYMYGDSWGTPRENNSIRIHMGTDIMDRENIRGRIPIVSMTDGVINQIGWNEQGGFRIVIMTSNNNCYYYEHLERFADGLQKGNNILAGQLIGYMGDTGYSKKEGVRGKSPVHLHLGISPSTRITKNEFWINPYLFLRMIEPQRVALEADSN